MFRPNPWFRASSSLSSPEKVQHALYTSVNTVDDRAVWVLDLQRREIQPDGAPLRMRWLTVHLDEALQVLASDRWVAKELYLLTSTHQLARPLALQRCSKVWECHRTQEGLDNPFWILQTDAGELKFPPQAASATDLPASKRLRWESVMPTAFEAVSSDCGN